MNPTWLTRFDLLRKRLIVSCEIRASRRRTPPLGFPSSGSELTRELRSLSFPLQQATFDFVFS